MKRPQLRRNKSRSKEAQIAKRRTNLSTVGYFAFNFLLPIVALILIRQNLIELAVLLPIISKWRVFFVKPRHLIANLRANSVDLIVKLSTISFMAIALTDGAQIAWTIWYIVWLTVVKPRSSNLFVGLQALTAQLLGITAVFQFVENPLNEILVLGTVWLISVSAARHFLSSYEEVWSRAIAYMWAFFCLEMAWILYRWTLVYVFIPQLVLIIFVVAYTLASLYSMYKHEKLSRAFLWQQLTMSGLILVALAAVADWDGAI